MSDQEMKRASGGVTQLSLVPSQYSHVRESGSETSVQQLSMVWSPVFIQCCLGEQQFWQHSGYKSANCVSQSN